MPSEIDELHALCDLLGVLTEYVDGMGRAVRVAPDTLVRVCSALGTPLRGPSDAAQAVAELGAQRGRPTLPPVVVAWDGELDMKGLGLEHTHGVELTLEDGSPMELSGDSDRPLRMPMGCHTLRRHGSRVTETARVVSAPTRSWRPVGAKPAWGIALHTAALRSRRSRSLADLRDLEAAARWIGGVGGDVVSVLPLLPTFNAEPAEPSPYSPVSRLFWNELMLDLGPAHRPVPAPARLDVTEADREVRAALGLDVAADPIDDAMGDPIDEELARYARFRGAQARLGRNWRDWPEPARSGRIHTSDIDRDEERFHRVAQLAARAQMAGLAERLSESGPNLGLDLAVGVHPDGYDAWSRQSLFAHGVSVGAPPDRMFPEGQNWGFPPLVPAASRDDGHRYAAAAIEHLARPARLLRVDHVMALGRLFWIPEGASVDQGTYVRYPLEELFAVLCLESHRHECVVVGENLGVVPAEIDRALVRHGVDGMYVAQAHAEGGPPRLPHAREVASIGTHDTATFMGWLHGRDIDERVRSGLLAQDAAEGEHERRRAAVADLVEALGIGVEDPAGHPATFLEAVLEWLAASESPLVMTWIEDLWLEEEQVNVPGTSSSERPNWQRPARRLLDDLVRDPDVQSRLALLNRSRSPTSST